VSFKVREGGGGKGPKPCPPLNQAPLTTHPLVWGGSGPRGRQYYKITEPQQREKKIIIQCECQKEPKKANCHLKNEPTRTRKGRERYNHRRESLGACRFTPCSKAKGKNEPDKTFKRKDQCKGRKNVFSITVLGFKQGVSISYGKKFLGGGRR